MKDWLKVNRLQLPLPNSQSNSAIDSIPENGENVNREVEKSEKNTLTAEEERLLSELNAHMAEELLGNVSAEKEAPESSKTYLLTSGVKEDNEHLFITSILQKAIDVKLDKQKFRKCKNF